MESLHRGGSGITVLDAETGTPLRRLAHEVIGRSVSAERDYFVIDNHKHSARVRIILPVSTET